MSKPLPFCFACIAAVLKKADSASTITPFLAALSLARIAGVTLGRHNGKVECCDHRPMPDDENRIHQSKARDPLREDVNLPLICRRNGYNVAGETYFLHISVSYPHLMVVLFPTPCRSA